MATKAFLLLISASSNRSHVSSRSIIKSPVLVFSAPNLHFQKHNTKIYQIARSFSPDTTAAIEVSRLAETARISLTSAEIDECGAKIRQVIDWFGQLQEIDVNSVEPALRAEMEGGNLREDAPETFENSDSIRASIPSFEGTYIKVPRVLNKE